MNTYKVLTYSEKHSETWNNFVTQSKNGTFLFHRDFMEYHHDRFEDYSQLVFEDNELVAIFPANKVGNLIYSHQGLTYGGLVLSNSVKFPTVFNAFKALLASFQNDGFETIHLKMIPAIYHTLPSDEISYILFLLDAQLTRRDALSVIDLKQPLTVSRDRIAGYKRALKQQLYVKEVDTFDEFWKIILEVNLHHKHQVKPVHSLEEITLLKKNFPKNIRQFNVYKDAEIVGGTTIFVTENVAHSQYISANEDKNTLGTLDFLHHYLITEVFAEKNYFDFGISNENYGKNINQGLHYWKEGFGARTIIQDFYQIKTSNLSNLDNVFI